MKEVTYSEAVGLFNRPERIVLAVSISEEGIPDIIALGWKMFASGSPPMVAIAVGKTRYSHKLISSAKEFTFAVPGANMAGAVLYCGTHSGRNVDKFKETELTPVPAKFIKPPLIKECIVNLECKVRGELDAGDHTIFAGEIVASYISEKKEKVLLSVGKEKGYECVGGNKGYRFGVIKG